MKEKLCFVASDPQQAESELKLRNTKYTSPHFLPASVNVAMDYTLGKEACIAIVSSKISVLDVP
jgi:hypothetical protein